MSTNLEIESIDKGGFKILKLKGRIDANWSLRLSEAINEIIRSGFYDIVLDAAEVDYISSAGVRVLLMSYKELARLGGSFGLYRPGENVVSIINMMGLSSLFDCSKFESAMNGTSASGPAGGAASAATFYGTLNGMDVNVLYANESRVKVKICGNIDKISDFSYTVDDAGVLSASAGRVAFGLGSLGADIASALERAGEFISVCGFAASMPSDGSKKPDYMIAGGGFVPEITYFYSAVCECVYSAAFTFKSEKSGAPVKLSDIVKTAHGVSKCDNILITLIGETAGLVGASLAAPPVSRPAECAFEFPQLRDNFNITAEPAYTGHMALCAGVSSAAGAPPDAAKFLRPLAAGSVLSGHFHAAVFDFTPLKKNCAEPAELVAALYEKGSPEAVFHLINDWRETNGAGETEFIGGTCWITRIAGYETAPAGGGINRQPSADKEVK
ncbi:MAG: STAS domain protein [bacterium ADurb.Bin243]|nr:MAG: STAS domain protein [bacterium ADurb.Bin243]HOD39361.1 STAS domain-containing protein [Candidatus Wallbacteria bacterium]